MGRRTGIAAVMAVAALVVGACGGDATSTTASTVAATTSTTTSTTTTVPLPAGCELVPYAIDLRISGDGALEPFQVTDAIAVPTAGGRAYTVYLADFPIDREDRSYSYVTDPPEGGIVVQTGLTVFNAEDPESVPVLEGGEVGQVDWEAGELATFLNVTAPDAPGFSVDMTGSARLVHLGDDVVCIEASITSESGFALEGTYTAETVRGF